MDLKKKNKEFNPEKYAGKIEAYITNLPTWMRDALKLTFAIGITEGAKANVYYNRFFNEANEFFKCVFDMLDENKFIAGDNIKYLHTASIVVPNPPAYISIDDILRPACPVFSQDDFPIKNIGRINAISVHINSKISIDGDAKKKLIDIVKELQSSFDYSRFSYTRVNGFINVLKAIAFISGDQQVKISHLIYLSSLWTLKNDANEFIAIVEPLTNNYDILAQNLRSKLVTVENKINSAKRAMADHAQLNYYDPSITHLSWDDLLVDSINTITQIKAEVNAALEGKAENKHTVEMFKLKKTIETAEANLLKSRGIKV